MLCSQRELGVWKASISLTGQREMATSFPFSLLTLATLMRVVVSLVIAALIVIGLTSPSGGQTIEHVEAETTFSSPQHQDGEATPFGRCLQDWDAGTHMTKQEWRGACRRLLFQRRDYLQTPAMNQ